MRRAACTLSCAAFVGVSVRNFYKRRPLFPKFHKTKDEKVSHQNMEIIMYYTVISPITILSHARYCGDHLACIPRKTLRILDSSDLEVIEALLTILSNSRIIDYGLPVITEDTGEYSYGIN